MFYYTQMYNTCAVDNFLKFDITNDNSKNQLRWYETSVIVNKD